MGLLTIYTVASPQPLTTLRADMDRAVASLGLSVAEQLVREDQSCLSRVEWGDPPFGLALWLQPVPEEGFRTPAFATAEPESSPDETVQTVCHLGTEQQANLCEPVVTALRLAGTIAGQGRIYDLHAQEALSGQQALERATQPFDVRNFVNYHYLAPRSGKAQHSWLHLHGMAKFFAADLEAFGVPADVSHQALALLMHLAQRCALGETLPLNQPMPYGHGAFRLYPADQARPGLKHFSLDDFDATHTGPTVLVQDAGAFGSLEHLLRGGYELEAKSAEVCAAEQQVIQARLEALRALWRDKKDQLVVRAALTVGTDRVEHIWLKVETWKAGSLAGRLLNDAFGDPALTRGSPVTVEETLVSGMAVLQEDAALEEVESFRALDPRAVAQLDQALQQDRTPQQQESSTSPGGEYRARFEDDGLVGIVTVERLPGGEPVGDPLWLYNRQATPPIMDARQQRLAGRPPLLSEVYTSQREPAEVPATPAVSFRWSQQRLFVELDQQLWAVLDCVGRRAWSRLIIRPNRFGRPWQELDSAEAAPDKEEKIERP